MRPHIRMILTGYGGECRECGGTEHDGPLTLIRKRVPGPSGYVDETMVGDCCADRLAQEYEERADRGEIDFVDAR